jgi:membrane protease YdiL (CAAX protease family)
MPDAVPDRYRTSLPFFLIATFALSWCIWLLPALASHRVIHLGDSMQMAAIVAGSFAPFVMGFVWVYRDGGWAAVRRFASRALAWRIGFTYLLPALLLSPLLGWAASWVYASHGGPPPALAVPAAQIPMVFLMLFFIGGSVNEEFGWGYAIDRMTERRAPMLMAPLLGAIWGLWHLPLFFIVGLTQSFLPFWAFLIFTVAGRTLFVWAYFGARRSLLATLLFHTATNLTLNLFVLVDRSGQGNQLGFITFALLELVCATFVVLASAKFRRALSATALA